MNSKIGLQPGSLIYTGNYKLQDVIVLEQFSYNEDEVNIETNNLKQDLNFKLISPESNDIFKYEQISLLLFDNLLITFQESPNSIFDKIKNRIEKILEDWENVFIH
ncbi:MAG: hypothetical protein ACRCW6_03445 [Mycoplasmoidaceae bacterium]